MSLESYLTFLFVFCFGALFGFFIKTIRANKHIAELLIKLTEFNTEKSFLEKQLSIQKNNEERIQTSFSDLSKKIYQEQQEKHNKQGYEQIENVMKPMREQLDNFRRRIDNVREQEVKERSEISEKIKHLAQLNQQMSNDAQALTKALTGDFQKQGSWGEVILEKVLETSGLQAGREYQKQQTITGDQGERLRPDIIINLPFERYVIIDSKVSLTAYHRYVMLDNDHSGQRHIELTHHIQSIQRHIDELSKKRYNQAKKLKSLDFVLMFIPIESALTVTNQQQNEIFTKALQKNILLVTPNTLFGVLKIIHSQWQVDSRSKNAEKIAEQGRKLYDQIASFVEDMEKIGKSLDQAQGNYEKAFNRLTAQRGNVLTQAEKLKKLGVSSDKQLPQF